MPDWRRPTPVRVPPDLVQAAGSPLLAELLFRRGFTTPAAAESFLMGGIDVDAPGLPDLEEGVDCLAAAVQAGERITVYGDYDTDGVTATALLVSLLRLVGANVDYYIPNRFADGYGMNRQTVAALAAAGTRLILTCDCGIKSLDEVAAARKLGLTVVVTDHHELGPALPNAHAVINPKRLPDTHPCRMLPGVGTAYLVARALLSKLGRAPADADQWLDLVAIGIIADVVPLQGANRELARRGLSRIRTSPCLGLQALLTAAGVEGRPDEEEIAFQVVPRLNAAGRLADARLGVRLLLSVDPGEAAELARQLDELNLERRKLTATVVEKAEAEAYDASGAILLYHPEWHEGVLGIAAGKLAEQHGVPAFLMARKHKSGLVVGSARAPEGFALHEALAACSEHLVKYGGHASAAGFSVLEEHLPAFRAAMREEVRRRTRADETSPLREAELELPLADLTRELYDDLRRAAPFGEGNPAPMLFAPRATLLSSRPVGPGERHLRLILRDGERSFIGLWWGAGSTRLEPGDYELFYRAGLNRFKGEEALQVLVGHLGTEPAQPRSRPVPTAVAPPELTDLRGQTREAVSRFPGALQLGEGDTSRLSEHALDRYRLKAAADLLLLSPPPSPGLLDEAVAITGARRLILAWETANSPEEERFLPNLMRLVAQALQQSAYVSVSRLAVATGELEAAVRFGIGALVESHLLAIDEEGADVLRLRRRSDGRGVRESGSLQQMRRLLAESRAFRRFLRTAPLSAIQKAMR